MYYLDIDLKNLLVRALNRIEINVRTQIVYHVSNHYKNSSTWFVDRKVMNNDFVDGFPKYYNEKFIKNNTTIKKHHQKYINDKYAPAWKTLEFLTFGNLIWIYKNLKDEDLKKEISNLYNIKKVYVFENYLGSALFVRNICAHGGVLYDSNTPKAIKPTPLIKLSNNSRHSLFASIQVILFLLGVVSENRKEELEKDIKELLLKYKANKDIAEIIVMKIGYDFNKL